MVGGRRQLHKRLVIKPFDKNLRWAASAGPRLTVGEPDRGCVLHEPLHTKTTYEFVFLVIRQSRFNCVCHRSLDTGPRVFEILFTEMCFSTGPSERSQSAEELHDRSAKHEAEDDRGDRPGKATGHSVDELESVHLIADVH